MLGVYSGIEECQLKKREGVKEKLYARLTKWKMFWKVLAAINLPVLAQAWWGHFSDPTKKIEDIQRAIVGFWPGKHWVRAAELYLSVADRGTQSDQQSVKNALSQTPDFTTIAV